MNSRSSEQTYPIIAASGDLLAVLGWLKEKNKAELVFVSTDVFFSFKNEVTAILILLR